MFRITKLIIKVDHCYKLCCLKWASGLEFCKVKVSSGLNAILAIVNRNQPLQDWDTFKYIKTWLNHK